MIVDQSPDGLEVLRGSSTYIYDGNWKLQTENGADGYHVSAVHWNYAATTGRRKDGGTGGHDPRHERRRAGPSRAAASTPSRTAICCCGPDGPTRRTGRTTSAATSMSKQFGQATRRLDGQQLAQPVPVSERVPDGPVQLADPHLSADRAWIRPKSRSTASRRRARAPRRGRAASASTRISSTPAAWRRRTTSRNSAPARTPIMGAAAPLERHVAAAPRTGSRARTRAAERDRPEAADERRADRGRRPVRRCQHEYWHETMQRACRRSTRRSRMG